MSALFDPPELVDSNVRQNPHTIGDMTTYVPSKAAFVLLGSAKRPTMRKKAPMEKITIAIYHSLIYGLDGMSSLCFILSEKESFVKGDSDTFKNQRQYYYLTG